MSHPQKRPLLKKQQKKGTADPDPSPLIESGTQGDSCDPADSSQLLPARSGVSESPVAHPRTSNPLPNHWKKSGTHPRRPPWQKSYESMARVEKEKR